MTLKKYFLGILFALLTGSVSAATAPSSEKLDSCKKVILEMPHDSTRLQQCFVIIQENINQYWALDFIEFAQQQAEEHHHLVWAMAFRGSKVRWCHRFHDWKRMEKFLREQREKAIKHNEYGNYMSQIGQSVIVMAQMGRFEQAWRYIQSMEKDLHNAGKENYERYEIYIYLVKADYYKYHGEETKRLQLLLAAIENNVQTNANQRISLHIELIDVFGQMGRYKDALMHADSVRYWYDTFSEKRKALPQSRGHLAEASLKKVEIYQKMGDFAMMKKSIELAEEYIDNTNPAFMSDIYKWWGRYYLGIKDYNKSMTFLDKSAEVAREHKSDEAAIHVEMEKMEVLRAMDMNEEALEFYTTKLLQLDSVHNVMIAEQQEYLDELNEMLSQIERGEKMKAWRSDLMAIVAVIMAIIVISILAYVTYTNRRLRKNHSITEQKLKEANDADKEKERFLRNITKLINEPLQHVVKGAKKLAEDTSMTPEEQTKLVAVNKDHVGRLLELVNNVLDLSRLEACMMKYTTREIDIVLSIMEFVAGYNMRNMTTPIRLAYDLETYTMLMDSTRFIKMIETLFSMPYNCSAPIPEHRAIKIEAIEENGLRIVITGSLYADETLLEETERMTNKINRYFLRDFGSEYIIEDNNTININISKT